MPEGSFCQLVILFFSWLNFKTEEISIVLKIINFMYNRG